MGGGATNSNKSEYHFRTPLRSLGSRKKLIRAGKQFSPSKALPLTIGIFLLVGMVSAAQLQADSSELEWKQPFKPESTDMPQHFSSGSTPQGEIEVKQDFSGDTGEIVWYRKAASESSWTEIENEELESKWDHDDESSDSDWNAQTFFPEDDGSIALLNEGDSETVTIDGNEHTFEVFDDNIDLSSSPPGVVLEVDGVTHVLYEGEYVEVEGKPVRADEITEDDVGNERVELDIYENELDPGDGNWEYKVEAATSSSDTYHSEPIYFDISGSDGNNIPYIQEVRVDNKTSYPFQSADNIKEGAVVAADVVQQEKDFFNVTLIDRNSGTELQERRYDPDKGNYIGDTVYSKLLDQTLGNFIDVADWQVESANTAVFKLSSEEFDQTDFLSAKGETYNIGFKIEDTTTSSVRNSVDYSTPISETNDAPTIDRIGFQTDYLDSTIQNFSELSTGDRIEALVVEVSDPDNTNDHTVKLNLSQKYDDVQHVNESTFSSPSFVQDNKYYFTSNDFSKNINTGYNSSDTSSDKDAVVDSGNWTASAEVSDSLNTVEKTSSVDIDWGELQFNNYAINGNQGDTEVLKNDLFWANTTIECVNGECASTNETVTVELDPLKNSEKTFEGPIKQGEKLSAGIKLTLFDRWSALASGDSLR